MPRRDPRSLPAGRGPSSGLPIDPDRLGTAEPSAPGRPPHRRKTYVFLVFVGGAVGTTVRSLVSEAAPHLGGVPVATMAINIVGAFLLGALLEGLSVRGPDRGRRRVLRLTIGTGMLGGFTTYSALSVDTDTLLRAGAVGAGVAYALITLAAGGLAAAAGIAAGRRWARPVVTG